MNRSNGIKPETWKTIAIVFIVLFVIETVIFVGIFKVGSTMVKMEEKCAAICGNMPNAGFYQYDDYLEICYCLDGNAEIVDTPNLK